MIIVYKVAFSSFSEGSQGAEFTMTRKAAEKLQREFEGEDPENEARITTIKLKGTISKRLCDC